MRAQLTILLAPKVRKVRTYITSHRLLSAILAVAVIVSAALVLWPKDILRSNWGDTPQQVIRTEGKDFITYEGSDRLIYHNRKVGKYRLSVFYEFNTNALYRVGIYLPPDLNVGIGNLPKYNGKLAIGWSSSDDDAFPVAIYTNR